MECLTLMIVVAIIGILAAVALPAYQDYTVRAKMSEVVLAGSTCRTAVTEAYQAASTIPSAGNFGCESTSGVKLSKYVQSVTTGANGVITVTAATDGSLKEASGKSIIMTPLTTAGATPAAGTGVGSWKCGPGTGMPAKYLPSSCRDS